MNMNRRDAIKLGAMGATAVAVTSMAVCSTDAEAKGSKKKSCGSKVLGKHKVLIIGGGFGGLSVANNLKKADKSFDIAIIEKNDTFMACPVSNTYLGKLKGMDLSKFIFDYAKPINKFGYSWLHSEVMAIDRKKKQVHTAAGIVKYEILVLSPGIGYDYENQFPKWSAAKIADVQRHAPGALIPGKEHITLERNLSNMDDGDVIITVPAGKFRCPPAPFERAAMIAAYMEQEDIKGKVIILNPKDKFAKAAAFKESWKDIYGNRIEHRNFCTIKDVNTKSKSVSYVQQVPTGKKDKDGFNIMKKVNKTAKYEVLNLIPHNKANNVIEMAGLATTSDSFRKVKMNGCSFRTKTDANIYAVGDVVGHGLPPSGATAVWSGKQCAAEIAHRLHGKSYTLEVKSKKISAANVCFSMVGHSPEEAIMVTHDFSWTGKVIKGKGNVPKDKKTGKYRSKNTAKALRDWYRGIMGDLFS